MRRREWLYRLGELVAPPTPPPGRPVAAAGLPRALIVDWMAAFQEEIGESSADAARQVENRVDGVSVWERDGEPVCLAGTSPPLGGAVRVGPVYTPPGHRGHGYAGALTAAVTRRALDGGAEAVLLSADAANAASNRLYRRLGFRALRERLVLAFDQRDGAHG